MVDPTGVEVVGAAFAQVASDRPSAVAVIDAGGELTYLGLGDRVRALAAALGATPPRHGPVLVLGGHDRWTVAAMLACAAAGLPSLVLDPRAPFDAHAAVLARHGARALVAGPQHLAVAARLAGDRPVLAADRAAAASDEVREVAPGDPATVAHTSGTAGIAKAVVHAHRSVVRNAHRYAASIDATVADRFLVASPLSTVAAATPVFAALLTGGAVVLHDVHDAGLADLAAVVGRTGANVVHVVPALLPHLPVPPPGGIQGVRVVALGGDRLLPAAVDVARRWFPAAVLLHRYSTSETNQVAGTRIAPGDPVGEGTVGVGRPVPWLSVRVVDDAGASVPTGVVGELEVAGEDLALGYLDDPERTAARFVETDRGRAYRTGDRARLLADGTLELLGRDDDVVKVRGVLVDLAAVADTLVRTAGATTAAVVVTGEPPVLTAFVTGDLRPVSARAAVAAVLPAAMVPAHVVVLPALPVTDRGKVDRRALAVRADKTSPPVYDAPRGLVEAAVAARFAEVLAVAAVGRDDDCFALGADSLAAEELCAAVAGVLGRPVLVTDLLRAPTPAALVAWSAASGLPASGSVLVPVTDGPADRTPAVLFSGGSGAYVEGMAVLARSLRARRCLAVLPRGFADGRPPDRTVDAIAGQAVAAIADELGEAPVVLIGHSVGGTIAMEAARQLHRAGREVAAVVLLDTRAITPEVRAARRPVADLRGALEVNRDVRAAAGQSSGLLRRAYWVPRYVVRRARRRLRAASAGRVRRSRAAQHAAFEALLKEAVRRWVDTGCDVPVVLVRAQTGRFASSRHADLRWDSVLSAPATVVWVPGDHAAITTGPYAATTAAAVDAALEDLGVR